MRSLQTRYLTFICLLSCCLSTLANGTAPTDDAWDGEHYVNNSDLQVQWATTYIQKLQLQGHERILDIGCGDGRVTAMMAKQLPNGSVVGIDTSESMLQVAQDLKNKAQLSNLRFILRDATNLGFENEFDHVVSFSCFHWIHDHFAALQGIAKSLKPAGKVFLYFAPDHPQYRIDHAIDAVVGSAKWRGYFNDFTTPHYLIPPLQFLAYAEKSGLLLKRLENIIVDEVFPNKAAFAAWMSGWMAHLKLLPQHLHQEFLEEIIDCYLIHYPIDAESNVHYIGYWVEVELFKSA